jgi:hypothetical protein
MQSIFGILLNIIIHVIVEAAIILGLHDLLALGSGNHLSTKLCLKKCKLALLIIRGLTVKVCLPSW